MSSVLDPMNDVDTAKLTATITDIRRSQPQHDRTSADDMRIVLHGLEERRDHHESNVRTLEELLQQRTQKWKDLTKALKTAETMVKTRPDLRYDIAMLKDKISKSEEQGAAIKQRLQIDRNIMNGTQKQIDEFDHAKLAQLTKEEAALKKVGLI